MPIKLLKSGARGVVLIVAIVASLWIYRAYLARGLPDLSVWHTHEMEEEFQARDFPDGIGFQEYAELEERLFTELDQVVYSSPESAGRFNRYDKSGEAFAGKDGQRWNRTFELHSDVPRGGVLLIHGASDSPYSTRALAELFNAAGLYVLSVRLPGNGTIPSGLRSARLVDWLAVTRMGVGHVRKTIGPDLPLYFAGYSVGGALALDYAIDSMTSNEMETPDRLFLYTPAIAVSPVARFSSWDLALARLPVFEKFNWLTVEPEYDPYKYNSFAKNAGHITYLLTERLGKKLAKLNSTAELPPMVAFQSLVDSTIRVDALLGSLFARLPSNGSQLILFDINRATDIENFVKNTEQQLLGDLAGYPDKSFDYTLVSNASGESVELVATTQFSGDAADDTEALNVEWPKSVYSLSHVSLPFRPDDRWYGSNESADFALGMLAPRGETAIMNPPIVRFMRLRHNPFFDYLAERTLRFCPACDN
jgi:alpha-beta hydrolase superfamily lysophospholipase